MTYNNDSHTEIIAKSAVLIDELTPEMFGYLISLIPTPERHSEIHERFEASFAGSLKGDPEKVKACEADRQAINESFAILHGLVKAAAIKDPTLPEKLGMGRAAERTASTTTTISAPKDFRIAFDSKGGQAFASLTKLAGAKIYEIWACDGDPSVEANWRLLDSSSKCQKIPILGLNRTKTNFLRVRGKSGHIVGPWSYYLSIDPA